MKSLRSLFLVLCLSLGCAFAHAQTGSVTVSGSNLQDSSGNKVTNATVCFAPTNATGKAISYRVNGNGQAVFTPVCAQVTAGAWTLTLADTNLTYPQNVCFNVTATDNTSGNSLLGPGYGCVQPAYNTSAPNNWCANGACNFDDYLPTGTNLQVSVAPAITGVNVTTGTPGGQASGSVTGSAPNYQLNLTIPQGAVGPTGQGFRERDAWTASTAYSPYDVFTYNNTAYVVNTTYTSGTTFGVTDTENSRVFAAAQAGTDSAAIHNNTTAPQTLLGTLNAPTVNAALVGVVRPQQGVQMPLTGWTAYHSFGDSITYGLGAYPDGEGCTVSDPACYVQQIAIATGTQSTLTNYGVPGDMACDTATHVFNDENPGATSTTLYTVMIGTNDSGSAAYHQGPYEDNYNNCFTAALSWLATQSTQKYTGASFGTLPTNWNTDTTYSQVTGIQSTTNGAVATFNYTITYTGQQVFLWYRIWDGNGGTFKVTDSSQQGTWWANNFGSVPIKTLNSNTQGIGVLIPWTWDRGPGSYTLTVTVTSATGAGNVVSILGVGTSPNTFGASTNPSVWASGPPRNINDYNQLSTQQYWNDATADIALLDNAGLNVYAAPTRSYWFSTPAEMYDTVHPNNLGHTELAEAFMAPTGIVPSATNPAAVSNLFQAMPYTGLIGSSSGGSITLPYYMSPTDGLIVVNNGTTNGSIYLPAKVNLGKRVSILNLGNSLITVYSPAGAVEMYMNKNQSAQFEYQYTNTWEPIATGGQDIGTWNAGIAFSSATMSCNQDTYFADSNTTPIVMTVPTTCAIGKMFFIANLGTASVTIAGATVGNVTTMVLQKNDAVLLTTYNGATWYGILSTNATKGLSAAMVAGSVTISSPAACTPSNTCVYEVSDCGPAGTPGFLEVNPANVVVGTSFTVTSSSSTDTSKVCYSLKTY